MDDAALSLLAIGRSLISAGYHFVTITPESHRRVDRRAERAGDVRARDLRDVFGWSRAFEPGLLPADMLEQLRVADAVTDAGAGLLRASVRFSSLEGMLFVHSAHPTDDSSAVFFGPDTYRFCSWVARSRARATRVVDVGCGSGAGGLVAAASGARVVLADINEAALAFARVNAALAGIEVELVQSDVLCGVTEAFDGVIANPPYMLDASGRTYRDGGGSFGEALAVRIARESLGRLAPGGSLLLYTGAAIVGGEDQFLSRVAPICREAGASFTYEELDPDVFGEELEREGYEQVERIAAVALTAVAR